MHHYVTIKDIAKYLGISVATVSRALRDTYDVSRDTRERVLKAAADLKYKPNYNAIGLAKRSTHTIGIILPFITNYYFSTVITGIQEVAYAKNYNIILFLTNDSAERELAVIENLLIATLDGLLVSISSDSNSCEHFQQVINEGVPIVFFDRVPTHIKTSKVMQDDFNGAFEAVEHLIKNGYRKIAHIAGPKGFLITERRLQGYLAALKKHDIPVNKNYILYSGFSQESGEIDTYKLLKCAKKPDAIFAANDRKAIGAMIALKKKKIEIGKKIGVIGFTNDPVSSLISPTLTTISEPAFEIGKESCELLFKHIKKKNIIPEEKILLGKLIIRESTARK
ncbi:MAG TPA: LacI family DNA-binding transcriptional regulator [Hanamia sp.]